MGIKGNLLTWFKSYLTNRKQRVILGGKQSSWGSIKAGVPQGSILGPLLFLVYINDITNVVNNNIRLFADDTTIFITVDDPANAAAELNSDLQNINNWANTWLVMFSPPKTESMLVSLRQNTVNQPPLFFNNNELTSVDSHKHLGITISNDLKWDKHIDNVIKTTGKKVDVLSRLMYRLDRKSLELLYTTYVRPSLEYGDALLCNISITQKENLELVQKRAGKIISGAIRGVSRDVVYNELGWESLETRREKHIICMFHKIVHGHAPAYLTNLLPKHVHQQSSYQLRNQNNYVPFNSRTNVFQNSFFPYSVHLWNLLNPDIRNIEDVQSFKRELCKNSPKTNIIHSLGSRKAGVALARIRMKCSLLKAHLSTLHIINYTNCQCGHEYEDEIHYFFTCQLYQMQRAVLHEKILTHAPFTLFTLLHGNPNASIETNETIVSAVHEYIDSTSRFY